MIEWFQEMAAGLPRAARAVDERVPTVSFEAGSFPDLPEVLACPGITIFKRQVFRGHGSNDSVRIVLEREVSTALGLWILGATLQRRHADYVLELTNRDSEVRQLVCRPAAPAVCGVDVREARFLWVPGELSDDLSIGHEAPYLSQCAELQLVNGEDDWADALANKQVLRGFGPLGGACKMAAFFLDFGLATQRENYGYIKDDNRSGLVGMASCEARVELPEAWQSGVMRRRAVTH